MPNRFNQKPVSRGADSTIPRTDTTRARTMAPQNAERDRAVANSVGQLAGGPAAAPTAGPVVPAALVALAAAPIAPVVGPVVAPMAGSGIINMAGALVPQMGAREPEYGILACLQGPQATKTDIRFKIWP